MLVLTRRPGEKIMIGNDVELEILESSQRLVKLGFSAPKQIEINRLELHNKIQENKSKELKEGPKSNN